MAFFRHYQCPECEGVFKFLHHPEDCGPPKRCDLCKAWMQTDEPEPVFVAVAPRIGTHKGVVPDQVYRQMERASESRTELMAEYGGGSASDYSHTKITDMNDDRHEGEIAAKYAPPSNYVQEFMRLNQGTAGAAPLGGGYAPMAGATGMEYAAAAHTGAFPHAGAATRDRIAALHPGLARAVEREGRQNKK